MTREQETLKARIKAESASISDNFDEIKERVHDAVDVRAWYRRNTAAAITGAAAGGLLLSLALTRRSPGRKYFVGGNEVDFLDDEMDSVVDQTNGVYRPSPNGASSRFRRVLSNSLDAIAGVAEDRMETFLSSLIPGFREHYPRTRR
jgi:hypothetical protein